MTVPLLDLVLQYTNCKEEIDKALMRVAASQHLILGKETEKLERTLAAYTDCKYAVGVSSGTDAILMALMALGIGAGDEVIMPTYSFFATAGTVARTGATPVFVDSEAITSNIDPTKIEQAITSRTKAIIPVHLYGQCAEMDEIAAIAERHNLYLIEDAAQALGAQYRDKRKAGSMGIMGCFSFYPTKNLGAFGDAGLISTNDEALYVKLRQMRNHGMEPRYYHKFIGGNFRIDEIQSAVLNAKFPYLESWHSGRRRNAKRYNDLFIQAGCASFAGAVAFNQLEKVLLPADVYHGDDDTVNTHIYHQYVVRVSRRDELRSFLSSKGISTEIYYPVPFHRQECFRYLNCNDASYPVANRVCGETLALPVYPELRDEQIEYVVQCICDFVNQPE